MRPVVYSFIHSFIHYLSHSYSVYIAWDRL